MASQNMLEMYLKQLHLPTFMQNYSSFAQDATRANLSFERYLLALCDAEVAQREANRVERAITAARFPVQKELSSFDFSAIQNIPKQRVLDLAQGGYLAKKESIILIGNPGLGKSHIAIGLALAACRQGKRVRFYGVASLVNDRLSAPKGSQALEGDGSNWQAGFGGSRRAGLHPFRPRRSPVALSTV